MMIQTSSGGVIEKELLNEIATQVSLPYNAENICIPAGYAVVKSGVYRAEVKECVKKNTVGIVTAHLTFTPFLVAAVKEGNKNSFRVWLLVRLDEWRGEWLRPSRLTFNRLASWLILPAPTARKRDVVEYARFCASVAPRVREQNTVVEAAREILCELFPEGGGAFPEDRPFPLVRLLARKYGVEPLAVRQWWERAGLVEQGPSRVVRVGTKTVRMLTFTSRTGMFLKSLSRPFV